MAVFKTLSNIENGEEKEEMVPSTNAILVQDLKDYLRQESSYQLELETGLPRHKLLYLVKEIENYADKNHDGKVTLKEWQDWIQHRVKTKRATGKGKKFNQVMQVLAYSPTYTCSPPTLFILIITCVQVLFYLLCYFLPDSMGISNQYGEPGWLTCTPLIYDPHRRREAWRFLTYMLLHGNHQHIISNMILQVVVGIPLEMGQPGYIGSLRVLALYFAGLILGALGASIVQPNMFLVGASAGIYALVMAHLSTLILNWKEDGEIYQQRRKIDGISSALNPWIRLFRLLFVIAFVLVDVGTIVYNEVYLKTESSTSYAGHAFGALAGLLIGILVLENRKVEDWELIFKWIGLGVFGLLLCAAILWHIIGTNYLWFPEETWESTSSRCLNAETS